MQSVVDELITWSGANMMNINARKTKEMVLGSLSRNPLPQIIGDSGGAKLGPAGACAPAVKPCAPAVPQ